MRTIMTIGLDIAKSVFQVHGVDAVGQVVIRRQLKRRYVLAFFQKLPSCLNGIEACASSHHWSRELRYTSAVVTVAPNPVRLLQSGGVHIRPHMAHRDTYCVAIECRLLGQQRKCRTDV
jgi:hypothetical protein